MKIVFMGTGAFACPVLRNILESGRDEVVAVVTQPDRPAGRRLQLKPCPVREFAGQHGRPVLTPEHASSPEFVARVSEYAPDLIVVCDYGQFLKANLLGVPRLGAINVHPSLLPKYRGAAPIQWAIANGERETGVTVLYVTEKMDAGDIITQERVAIRDDDTPQTLGPRLAETGGQLIVRALESLRCGAAHRMPQVESAATYAPKLKKEDGRIDWSLPAKVIAHRIRGFQPWPGAYCEWPLGSAKFLKILKARVEDAGGAPGTVIGTDGAGPLVACGTGSLRLLEVQPEGKKPMSGSAFLCGHRLMPGAALGR